MIHVDDSHEYDSIKIYRKGCGCLENEMLCVMKQPKALQVM